MKNRIISHSVILLSIFLIVFFAFGFAPVKAQQRPEVQPVFPPQDILGDLSKIELPLSDYMEKAKESELIPVILILERQLTKEEKAKLFSEIIIKDRKEMKKEIRRGLIRELKQLARAEQANLVKFLSALEQEKQVMHVKSLWISNVVGVKAPKAVIKRLTAFREIKSIHLDIPRPVKGQTAWGVSQIQADQVWSLVPTSYDGTGVTVAILDTGVDYNHGDLSGRMWINTPEDINGDGQFTAADNNGIDDDGNGFIDDVVGWNFSGAGSNDPDDVNGHGTHVAGTVAGDGTGGTNTGVAPGARIMALRESNIIALSLEQECWAGMQYALDNGADIVNFSSGWLDSWTPAYATWRNNVTNLMDAGVLFVTIAHNDSSTTGDPNNVRTPGRVPLAVTLGATDNTDTIWVDSNNGPVSWQTVSPFFDYPWPPGLLKPDVSAPGVSVNSTQNGGGYVNGPIWSGTSMAAPHAAGTAALLLEEDPSLSPYEIKFLLEETAVDLGATGPDNAYGWGRINALSAINYTIDPTLYDLSVTGTSAVWTSADIWVDNNDDGTPDIPVALSNNHLYARIRNIGGQVVSNVEVKFYYANVATMGISGFDPNGDGDPADGNFTYIGSYNVPTIGPSGSNHDEAIAIVNWNIPVPSGHWCVGIGIVATNPPNAAEVDTSNNAAFKNFFNITTSAAAFSFNINPLPMAPNEPFAVEFVKKNLPEEAKVELVIDKALEKIIIVKAEGLSKIDEPLLKLKTLGEEYFKVLEREIKYVRYEMTGNSAVLDQIVSPKGEPIPVRIIIRMPEKVEIDKEMLLIINTLNKEGKPVGGLTLKINAK